MRIIIINKFLYPRGGDCIYSINLKKLLESYGHKVAFFAMKYPDNFETEYDGYFPNEVSFTNGGIKNKFRAISRIFNSGEVLDKFTSLIDDFKPDIVHLNNVHSYISPSVAQIAHRKGAKVIWTLHDYKLLCPSYSCLRKGNVCELCFYNKFNVVKLKCMKNSLPASVLGYLEALYWNKNKLSKYIDTFICPSEFMQQKMLQGGFNIEKLKIVSNFIEKSKTDLFSRSKVDERENAYCYIGRLSEEKGVDGLLNVASNLMYKLYIAGSGPLDDYLRNKYQSDNIVFLGHLSSEEVVSLVNRVKFCVVPSIWYENNPLSVIESLSMGTPVLGANIGGIPELIDNENGELFAPNDLKDLKEKIIFLFNKRYFNYELISQRAKEKFSEARYYSELLKIYQ